VVHIHRELRQARSSEQPDFEEGIGIANFIRRREMNTKIRLQLSIMMFAQFFIWGAWYVTAPNYLGTYWLQGRRLRLDYSVGPIAGMISPFFVGMIATGSSRRSGCWESCTSWER
jgi:hypothetical protein